MYVVLLVKSCNKKIGNSSIKKLIYLQERDKQPTLFSVPAEKLNFIVCALAHVTSDEEQAAADSGQQHVGVEQHVSPSVPPA
jgi:hypothetical protein